MAECPNVVQGLPVECRKGNKYVLLRGIFLTTSDFEFSTFADAGDQDNWLDGVVNKQIFPVHFVEEIEDTTEVVEPYTSPSGDKKKLRESKRSFRLKFDLTLDQHKVLRSYSGQNFRLFWYDQNNNILGTSQDGVVFKGMDVGFIDTMNLPMPVADAPMFSTLDIQLEDASELDDFGHTLNPLNGTVANRWYPKNIGSTTKVTISQVGTVSGNSFTFDVKYESTSDTDNDGDAISTRNIGGLDVTTFTNFLFTDGSSTVTPNTMSEDSSVTGRYTADFTTFTTGTAQILATSSNLVESNSTSIA